MKKPKQKSEEIPLEEVESVKTGDYHEWLISRRKKREAADNSSNNANSEKMKLDKVSNKQKKAKEDNFEVLFDKMDSGGGAPIVVKKSDDSKKKAIRKDKKGESEIKNKNEKPNS